MTRFTFDTARQVLRGQDIGALAPIEWLNHGAYALKGIEEPLEVCEVGERGFARLAAPPDSEKARRQMPLDGEPVLGWRPALELQVPNTSWVLEKKLGEGGFGEVWLARHERLKKRAVFKFCFRADRVRSLKREVTLFTLLKERIGEHPHIVSVQDVFFDEPPFYIIMDYVEGADLAAWCELKGSTARVPLAMRLEVITQVADALQAAHDAGIIHRDVKPSNILVSENAAGEVRAKLTDFGIGRVVSDEVLAGMTRLGFTMTVAASDSLSGTQMYMAPELIAGKPASAQSDIYSLAVVLFQSLAGDFSRPLTMDWVREIGDPILREDLAACFAGDLRERLSSAGELAWRLRTLPQRQRERIETDAAARERGPPTGEASFGRRRLPVSWCSSSPRWPSLRGNKQSARIETPNRKQPRHVRLLKPTRRASARRTSFLSCLASCAKNFRRSTGLIFSMTF